MAKFRLRNFPGITFPSLDAIIRWQEQKGVNIIIHKQDHDGIRWIDSEPVENKN